MPTFRGAIFDVDGVLVDSPHEKAWRESLRQLMEQRVDLRVSFPWLAMLNDLVVQQCQVVIIAKTGG